MTIVYPTTRLLIRKFQRLTFEPIIFRLKKFWCSRRTSNALVYPKIWKSYKHPNQKRLFTPLTYLSKKFKYVECAIFFKYSYWLHSIIDPIKSRIEKTIQKTALKREYGFFTAKVNRLPKSSGLINSITRYGMWEV